MTAPQTRLTSRRRHLAATSVAAAGALLLSACLGSGTPTAEPGEQTVSDPPTATSSPTATETPTSTPTETATAEPRTITLVAAGDILPHRPVVSSARRYAQGSSSEYDFRPMFDEVRPVLSAGDLALCHLETPLSADNRNLAEPNTMVFNSPREVAAALKWAGYDGCDFASNHSWDRGLEGLRQTISVVEDEGLGYAGPTAEESEAGQAAVFDVAGVQVAHLAYSYTLFNNWGPNTEVPPEAPWTGRAMWPVVEADGILADVAAARAEGADIVVLSMHWGEEYVTQPTRDQRELAETLLTSGAVDAILGTHVHVVQPCETIAGRPVLYGMGNSLSNQGPKPGGSLPAASQEGIMVELTFTVAPDGEVTSELAYRPTRVNLDGHLIELTGPDKHPEAYARTVATVELFGPGACEATVVPAP